MLFRSGSTKSFDENKHNVLATFEEDEMQAPAVAKGAASMNRGRKNTMELTNASFAEQNPTITETVVVDNQKEEDFYSKKRLLKKADQSNTSSKFPMIRGPKPTKVTVPPACCCLCFGWK